jgi:hypothetical protein
LWYKVPVRAEAKRFVARWFWLLSCILATVLFVGTTLGDGDGLAFAVAVLAVTSSCLIGIVVATGRRLAFSLMLVICVVLSVVLFFNYSAIRTTGRWALLSRKYKAQVLAQAIAKNGEFRHVEWDGWGMAGIDTTVYLVFDPENSLASAAKRHSAGKYEGIPCEVPSVRRLESQWYAVQFYTNDGWEGCSAAAEFERKSSEP